MDTHKGTDSLSLSLSLSHKRLCLYILTHSLLALPRKFILFLHFQENMDTENLEDGLLTTKPRVNCRDVSESDSKATPIVILSCMVAYCGSITVGCSVSTTRLSWHMEQWLICLISFGLLIINVFFPKNKWKRNCLLFS